jgi:hypothetical protein
MSRRRATLLAMLFFATPTHAAVLCRAGSGKLSLREACRKAEQAVNPAEIDVSSLIGPAGDTGAPGARGRFPIAIVDGAGTELGSTLWMVDSFGLGAIVSITHPALTETVAFVVDRNGFVPKRGGAIATVYYQALDCAGVPHVRPMSSGLRIAQVYGDSLYYETTSGVVSTTVSSVETDTGSPCGGGATATARGTCCGNFGSTQFTAPAIRVPLANLGFVPPFRGVPR